MKIRIVAACMIAVFSGALAQAQDMPEMPKPQKEHEWLKQLTGEWEYEAEMTMDPGKPPIKAKGTESVRDIGGFWTMSENKGEFMGKPFTGIMTLGYSPEKKKYVATWVDNMNSMLWTYEGTVDESGKKLTLTTEGPCPMQGGKIVKMEETLEIKSPDNKVFTSKADKDGKWETGMVINYKKK